MPKKLLTYFEMLIVPKSENDYMIMPENINKNLEQKRGPNPPPPKKKIFGFGFFVKIHILENSK